MNPKPLSIRSRAIVPVGMPVSSDVPDRPQSAHAAALVATQPENGGSVGASPYGVKEDGPARFPRPLRPCRRPHPRLRRSLPRPQSLHHQGLRRHPRRGKIREAWWVSVFIRRRPVSRWLPVAWQPLRQERSLELRAGLLELEQLPPRRVATDKWSSSDGRSAGKPRTGWVAKAFPAA